MGRFRHCLGTFSGLGTGLVNFCVVASCFVSIVYENTNFTNCVRFAGMITHHHATLVSGGWSVLSGQARPARYLQTS